MIPANFHTDDCAYHVRFDALPWFNQASEAEIDALASCGWGGDYAADAVAVFMADTVPELAAAFRYLEAVADTRAACGFEVYVSAGAVEKWRAEREARAVADALGAFLADAEDRDELTSEDSSMLRTAKRIIERNVNP